MTSRQNTFIQETIGLQVFDAIQLHHFKRVQYFLKNGLDPDLRDHQRRTLLMSACSLRTEKTALKFCNLLLKHKAKIQLSDKNGLNALHYAVLNEHNNVVARFLEFAGDYDINMQDNHGNTALMLAVFTRNYPIVQNIVHSLRKYDLSVDHCNEHGMTPLILATILDENELTQSLIHYGKASTEIRDKHFRKSARDWERISDPHKYHDVLEELSTLHTAAQALSVSRYPTRYHDVPKNPANKNPTLKHAILRNPSQYINYPTYVASQNEAKQRAQSKGNMPRSKGNTCRYPDLKPVYNLYEQELASSYRKSAPPREKTPPPPSSGSSSDRPNSWRRTMLSLKLNQRRHTIALSRSLPNTMSTKNLFQRPGLAVAAIHARSLSLGTKEAVYGSSKWSPLPSRRSSLRLPCPTPATAPGGMGSNYANRRSSKSGNFPQKIQRRHSVSFQSLVIAVDDGNISPQSPRTPPSVLQSLDTKSPILEEDFVHSRDG